MTVALRSLTPAHEEQRFLDTLQTGPAVLVIEGEAGIGKTTRLREALADASEREYHVLSCRPTAVEADLAYAALGDLLDPYLPDVLDALPAPQRHALELALLLAEANGGHPADPRAIALALRTVLRALAERKPVLVAVDDAQWLDAASARAISFAARRLDGARIGLLVTRRLEPEAPDPLKLASAVPELLARVRVAPLDERALEALLRDRLGTRFLRPTVRRLHAVSGGNPFFALELATALGHRQSLTLPVPDDLGDLVRARLSRLPDEARAVLGVVASLAHPTRAAVRAAVGAEDGLEAAIAAGVLEPSGERLRFTHPLLGFVAERDLTPEQRRALHAKFAELAQEPEQRARHLALACREPDEQVARALETAAARVHARGAPDAAAELAERAAELTPDRAGIPARLVLAGRCHFDAGDPPRAATLMERALSIAAPGPEQARVHIELGTVRGIAGGPHAAVEEFRLGLAQAAGDQRLRARLEQRLAYALQLTDVQAAAPHARAALALAEGAGEPALLAQCLATLAMIEFQLGHGVQREPLTRALALEHDSGWLVESPRFVLGYQLVRIGELDAARDEFTLLAADARRRGDASLCLPLVSLTYVELRSGDVTRAREHAEDAWHAAAETGRAMFEATALCARARVETYEGNEPAARALADQALALAEATQQTRTAADARSALGLLELSCGDAHAARAHLSLALAAREAQGVEEPCLFYFLPDAVEALVGVHDLAAADALLTPFEQRSAELDRRWARACAARCRGLIESARGNHEHAIATLEAITCNEPLEHARTLLALGMARRRAQRKQPARAALNEALERFESLGARLWSDRAREALDTVGGRHSSPNALTDTERAIAELVATGRSNGETAAALFLSPKTVEWNLTKVYRKLHVATRTELAAKLAVRKPGGIPGLRA